MLSVVFFHSAIWKPVIFILIFRNADHFIRKLDESKQTKQNGLYVTAVIFSRYSRIRTYLLLENTSYAYRMLSLEKVVNFLSHSNERSEQ